MSTPDTPPSLATREVRPASDAPAATWAEYLTDILRDQPGRYAVAGVVRSLRELSPRVEARQRERLALEAVYGLALALCRSGLAAVVRSLPYPDACSRGPGVRLLQRAVDLVAGNLRQPETDERLRAAVREVLAAPSATDELHQILTQEVLGGAEPPAVADSPAPTWGNLGEARQNILIVLGEATKPLDGAAVEKKAGYHGGSLRKHFAPLQRLGLIEKVKDGYVITPLGKSLLPV